MSQHHPHHLSVEHPEFSRLPEGVEFAGPADAAVIYELINAESDLKKVEPEEVAEWIRTGLSVITRNASGEIVGHSGAIEVHPKFLEIRGVVVASECRGGGVAIRLQEALLAEVDRRFPDRAVYWVATDHPGSRRLIEHMGGIELSAEERDHLLRGPLASREGSLESRDVFVRPPAGAAMQYNGSYGE